MNPTLLGGVRALCAALGAMVLVASGCTHAPAYRRPAADVMPQWPAGPAYVPAAADHAATPVASRHTVGGAQSDRRQRQHRGRTSRDFPRVTLTGKYGTASTQFSGLFSHGSTAWTFSPQISLPIFAAGANVASLRLANTQKSVYVAQYEQTIQTAFREVADALAGRGTLERQIAAERQLVAATGASYRLADLRFRNGVVTYLSVLDSQRSLYGAEQALVGVQLARLQNLVTLYKALGGGWNEHTVQGAAAAAGTAKR